MLRKSRGIRVKPQNTTLGEKTGITPYPLIFFIIVMTAMFHDIHKEDRPKTARQRIEGMTADEILYAGDTMCVTQTAAAM